MSKLDDPARLFDARSDTTAGVRAVLRSGQRGLPGPDQLARLAARLPLGPLPPPSGAPPAGSLPVAPVRLIAPVAATSALPGVIVGALFGLAVVAAWAWRDAASSPPDNSVAAVAVTNVAAPIAAPPPVAPRPLDARVDRPDPAARAPAIAPSSPRGAGPAFASAEGPQGDAPIPAASGAPAPGGSPSSADSGSGLASEVQLLRRAQSVLGADPGAALAIATEHARRFPGGALAQERELIAVSALVALGRRDEARPRAASLIERFPGSAYRARLESLGLGK